MSLAALGVLQPLLPPAGGSAALKMYLLWTKKIKKIDGQIEESGKGWLLPGGQAGKFVKTQNSEHQGQR